jgi:hypothetical protein
MDLVDIQKEDMKEYKSHMAVLIDSLCTKITNNKLS